MRRPDDGDGLHVDDLAAGWLDVGADEVVAGRGRARPVEWAPA